MQLKTALVLVSVLASTSAFAQLSAQSSYDQIQQAFTQAAPAPLSAFKGDEVLIGICHLKNFQSGNFVASSAVFVGYRDGEEVRVGHFSSTEPNRIETAGGLLTPQTTALATEARDLVKNLTYYKAILATLRNSLVLKIELTGSLTETAKYAVSGGAWPKFPLNQSMNFTHPLLTEGNAINYAYLPQQAAMGENPGDVVFLGMLVSHEYRKTADGAIVMETRLRPNVLSETAYNEVPAQMTQSLQAQYCVFPPASL